MANRQTFTSQVNTKIIPKVTNAIHRDVLINDLAANIVFGEDVAVVQTSAVSAISVNFSGKDRVDLTRTGGSLLISVSGIGDGETKYLLITKTAGQAITWSGVTDITNIKDYVTSASIVLYEIVRKSSYYFAKAWVETIKQATDTIKGVAEIATASECNALSNTTNIVTPGRIPLGTTSQKGLLELATNAEALAGTDTARALTAQDLKYWFDNYFASELAMNLSGKDATVTVTWYRVYRVGRLMIGTIKARCSTTSKVVLGQATVYPIIGGTYETLAGRPVDGSYENAILTLNFDGKIEIQVYKTGTDYVFDIALPIRLTV